VSVRDIECLQGSRTREHSISNYTNVKWLRPRACSEKVHLSPVELFAGFSPALEPPEEVVQGHGRF
jgi:hypothetical protein